MRFLRGATLHRRLEWLAPAALAAYFSAVAVLGASARYSTPHLLALVGLYGLLALLLYSGSRLLAGLGKAGGLAGAFAVTLTAVWHLREQTFFPGSILAAVALAVLLAPLCWLVARRLATSRPVRSHLRGFLAAAVGFAAAWLVAFEGSTVLRWHLLRHNTLLGTPAYYLLATPAAAHEQELFERLARRDAPPGPPAYEAASRPNIVFILLDTLRADALAAWGGEGDLMPQLDRFLDGAYRFTDVWANASWTRPSMGSYFTGLLPEEHGARDIGDRLPEARVTLAEVLRERGYETTAFVANIAAVGRSAGFSQGFDRFVEIAAKPYARARQVNRSVRGWLEQRPRETAAPAFLYLHYLDPHEPYLSGREPGAKRASEYLAAYREELRYLDRELAEILALLQQRLPGPTVFFFASDHGEEFFEHELFGHGHSLYEELIHVPVALAADGAGAALPARLEARDFFDLLLRYGEGFSVEDWSRRRDRERRYASIYYSQSGRLILRPYLGKTSMRAVEEGGMKLIWSGYGDTHELYDLTADSGETRNLAALRPGLIEQLAAVFDEPVRFWTPAVAVEATAEDLEQLRDLGYVD